MIPENYLEYLSLNNILESYISYSNATSKEEYCDMWFADMTHTKLNLTKLKERVTKLQKDLLVDYLCTDNTLKKD